MTDLFPWSDPTAVIRIAYRGEPIVKARARTRISANGKRSSYTPARTVKAQAAVARIVSAVGFTPTDAHDFAVGIHFRLATWVGRDIDNLAKLVLDAMTGIVWVDDDQVRRLVLTKDHGCDVPGTTIRLALMPAQRRPVVLPRRRLVAPSMELVLA